MGASGKVMLRWAASSSSMGRRRNVISVILAGGRLGASDLPPISDPTTYGGLARRKVAELCKWLRDDVVSSLFRPPVRRADQGGLASLTRVRCRRVAVETPRWARPNAVNDHAVPREHERLTWGANSE